MKVLLIGGGGREHALAWSLKKSPRVRELYCAPGNGGIAQLAECVPIAATDIGALVDWAQTSGIDFAVVAPDDPLAMGLVDAFAAAGIRAFGPTRAAARLESSKVFAKGLMQKYGIPTAAYQSFDALAPALRYAAGQGTSPEKPLVIKADGLALGKGVVLAQSPEEAEQTLRDMMQGGRFQEAGRQVVIEEYLQGPEVTVLSFTDGRTLSAMPASQDHKRAFDGNRGPNTGGMGVVSPVAAYTPELAALCRETIFLPTIRAMEAEGCPFAGVLYFGLMLTPEGPRVIEYNARFGDPEAQAVLPLLQTDLMEILEAVQAGTLADCPIAWRDEASACVVLASGGYPGAYRSGCEITGLGDVDDDALVFHAGTARDGGRLVTKGGRVLSVCATAPTLPEALDKAYQNVGRIQFDGAFYRRDIGAYSG